MKRLSALLLLLLVYGAFAQPVVEQKTPTVSATAAFNTMTGGTNTSATMTVGTGSTLTYAGNGILNASEITGLAFPSLVSGDCLTNNGTILSWTTCSSGGSGTVNSGTSGQLTYYASTGTAVSGNSSITVSSGTLSATGYNTGAASGVYEIGGINFLFQPDADTSSVAVGENAGSSQSTTNLANSYFGYYAGNSTTNNANGGNTYLGSYSGQHGTSGFYNTAVGQLALRNNTTGFENTVGGVNAQAGASGVAVSGVTAFGYQACQNNQANDQTCFGLNAGENLYTGQANTAIGVNALETAGSSSTGEQNATAVGQGALQDCNVSPSGGVSCGTAVGYQALQVDTTGYDNNALGSCMQANTTGYDNTCAGTLALNSNVSGNENTGIGDTALWYSTGSNNSAFGWGAGTGVSGTSTFTDSTLLGHQAGYYLTTGNFNICVGELCNITTGSSNIIIGNSITTTTATASNQVNIGNLWVGVATLPTVTSGAGTSPSVSGNGTAVFKVTEGATGTPSTSLVVGMPAGASNDWVCTALDRTSSSITARQSGSASTSAVTITFSSAPANSDVIQFQCGAM
jgi:trimeric autotransporter adhesin